MNWSAVNPLVWQCAAIGLCFLIAARFILGRRADVLECLGGALLIVALLLAVFPGLAS